MANFMNSILVRKPGHSKFPLTHEFKDSIDFGENHPFLCEETAPGDIWRVKSEAELKFQPLISPVMHRINLFTNYFYVPWYQVWSAYDDFISGGRNGDVKVEMPWLHMRQVVAICACIGYNLTVGDEKTYLAWELVRIGFKHSVFGYIGISQHAVMKCLPDDWSQNENLPGYLEDTDLDQIAYNTGLLPDISGEEDVLHINVLPSFALEKVYHDYYQDETLDDDYFDCLEEFFSINKNLWVSSSSFYYVCTQVDKISSFGENYFICEFFKIKHRAWEHDYFTSALPFAQRGEDVKVPLGEKAPVKIPQQEISLDTTYLEINNPTVTYNGGALPEGATHWNVVPNVNNIRMSSTEGDNPDGDEDRIMVKIQGFDDQGNSHGGTQWVYAKSVFSEADYGRFVGYINKELTGEADLSNASAISINTFRYLERLQSFLEKNARAGWRYIEQLAAHWGVRGDDATLHRAQWITGSVKPVKIGEVLQTSQTTESSPQAQFSGYARADGNLDGFKRYFKYHGYVIGLYCVLPRTNYMQGIRRHLLKSSRYEFLFPDFAHLGEQEVYNAELYYDPANGNPKGIFGYMPRYSEYRTIPSTVHGDFEDSLEFWHMARKFRNEPILNSSFIYSNPTNRIFAVERDASSSHMLVQILNSISCVRELPKYGSPNL